MKTVNKSKASLFIMELVIVILFFSICAAVCMRLFAAAKVLSHDSETLNHSVLLSQSAAEAYKGSLGNGRTLEHVKELIGGTIQGEKIVVFFDDQWNEVGKNQGAFSLVLTEKKGMEAEIAVFRIGATDEDEIFSLNIKAIEG